MGAYGWVVDIREIVHVHLVLVVAFLLVDIWLEATAEIAHTLESNTKSQGEHDDCEDCKGSQRLCGWGVSLAVVAISPDSSEFEDEVGKSDNIEELLDSLAHALRRVCRFVRTMTTHCSGLFSLRTMAAAAISTKIVTGTATMVR